MHAKSRSWVHLEREQRHAKRWNLTWALTFGAAAVGSFAVGYANPFPSMRDGLFVSAGKASIGALGRIILPLRIGMPAPAGDTCADLVALRDAVRAAARKERGNFYVNHVGGLLVNGAVPRSSGPAARPAKHCSRSRSAMPIGLLSNYMAPRNSWHLHRDRNWTVGVVPQHERLDSSRSAASSRLRRARGPSTRASSGRGRRARRTTARACRPR